MKKTTAMAAVPRRIRSLIAVRPNTGCEGVRSAGRAKSPSEALNVPAILHMNMGFARYPSPFRVLLGAGCAILMRFLFIRL